MCPLCNSGYAVCQAVVVDYDSGAALFIFRHQTVHLEPRQP